MWSFLKIKEDNITHHDFHEEFKKPYNLYNIFSPHYQSLDNCRQDIIPSIYDKILNEAKNNSDKNFLIILDAGEHVYQGEPSVDSKIKNLFVFNRKFHCANYNWFGSSPPPTFSINKSKWFYCPIGRADVVRTRFFDELVNAELHQKNSVSYLCTNFPERIPDPEEYTKTGGTKYKDMIPYNNFEGKNLNNKERNLPNWIEQNKCLFGIDIEVGSVHPTTWYTERLYNIVSGGLIPVVVSGAGSLGQLENMGFIVPDYLNWRLYDLWPVDSWGTGPDKIKSIIKNLVNFTTKYKLEDIAKDWYPSAIKNQEHFKKLKDYYREEEKEICKWILVITHNLSNKKYQQLY